ncbi:hypothetical protein DEJ17_09710 [Curtobacterium sp. MCSS17_011]|uniref:hypothetical protein n=1 Tax=Curtobacterium sp. MCSS17_011 TaxID=2175643 RepID=UPI000D97B11A|nr:hypothetical protein [Curtobacterium sp. MCSS17_011]PYY57766.1 hypothetical protein DEJ17_09710 [Curtobacterium sp. MCSS17_011]
MAILSQRFQAYLTDRMGSVPEGLAEAVAPLTAGQRDGFTAAWLSASDSQHERPADAWVLTEADRDAFETFRVAMLGLDS